MTYFCRLWFLFVVGGATFGLGCSHTPVSAQEAIAKDIESIVKDDPSVHAALIAVDAPTLGLLKFKKASGDANPNSAFLSASIGKLFVAATLMKMVEKGELKTQDLASDHIDAEVLQSIFPRGASKVSIDMLLRHTSGAADYFSGKSHDGSPNVLERIRTHPQKAWTRQELLEYCSAHFTQVAEPGVAFHYSDTNYDLLGLVIESLSKEPFAARVRREIIDPLGLSGTWYHAFEPPRSSDIVKTYVGNTLVTNTPALSMDQAGGGLYTTLDDLTTFMRALNHGGFFGLQTPEEGYRKNALHAGIDVGRGLWRIRPSGFSFLLGAMPNLVGHSGATGAWAYYIEKYDAVVVGSFNQTEWTEAHIEFLLSKLLPTLMSIKRDDS